MKKERKEVSDYYLKCGRVQKEEFRGDVKSLYSEYGLYFVTSSFTEIKGFETLEEARKFYNSINIY